MVSASQRLDEIKEEVRELRVLYKELIERLVPVETPTKEERKALEKTVEVAGERELMRVLGVHGQL